MAASTKYIRSLLSLLLVLQYTTTDYIKFNGFQSLPQGYLLDGLNMDELSGICYNSVDGSYYAVVDNLITNKGFYEINFDVDNKTDQVNMTLVSGIQMERSTELPLTGMDTESIVFIENPSNASESFFIVGQEGHKDFDTENALYQYSVDGSYIRTLSDQLPVKFDINNTENNKGIEGLSVDKGQSYLVYTTERALLSDRESCVNATCMRLSVNDFSVDDNGYITINELYELRCVAF